MLKGIKAVAAQMLLVVLAIAGALSSHAALADFTKTIEVTPGVQVNAVTVWYDLSCTQSAGGGSFTVVTAPTNGTLAYKSVNGIPPGCPAGGPALPAAQALYTWTAPSSSSATSDYIQLFYQTDDGSQSEYIDITVQLETPLLIASTLPNGTAGVVYGPLTLVSGGTPPYTVSASGLPTGLSVGADGLVSGTPAATDSGTYQVTVSVTDSAGAMAGPQTVTITIAPELVPPVIASMLPNGTAGVAYPSTVLVSGGAPPYNISAVGLPPGLNVGDDGIVSGTPAATDSGTYQVTVSVTDSAGEAAGPQTVSIYITPKTSCSSAIKTVGFPALKTYGLAIQSTSSCPALVITSPTASQDFQFDNNNFTSTTIPFSATSPDGSDAISWTVRLTYTTSGGIGPFTYEIPSFSTYVAMTKSEKITDAGGQLQVSASQATSTASINAEVTGADIPNQTITSRLLDLYHPPLTGYTVDLLAHIALNESSYQQFVERDDLYDTDAPWPNENDPTDTVAAGAHIGLMMVLTDMSTAFSWLKNTQAGANDFATKIKACIRYQNAQIKKIKGLGVETGVQIENCALIHYFGYRFSYYIPKVVKDKTPVWATNPKVYKTPNGNISAAEYVRRVRSSTIPN